VEPPSVVEPPPGVASPPDAASPAVEPPPGDTPPPVEAPPSAVVDKRPPRRPPPRRPPPAPPAEARPEPKPAEVEEQGFLTLDTVPWTTVFLGKRKLGETPLVRLPVPAGVLELTLVNAEAGIREGYVARVKAGEVTRTRLDLR
jgi:serine/threonine-protein kinase